MGWRKYDVKQRRVVPVENGSFRESTERSAEIPTANRGRKADSKKHKVATNPCVFPAVTAALVCVTRNLNRYNIPIAPYIRDLPM
tara:strand:+ start:3783 stop:4037 length:255 start_codon:yes stop_codon:yes gene_type:complete